VGIRPPGPGQTEAFGRYLKTAMTAKSGRDVTVDLWGNPYTIDRDTDGNILVISTGPNGVRDRCRDGTLDTVQTVSGGTMEEGDSQDDDICEKVRPALRQDSPFRQIKDGY